MVRGCCCGNSSLITVSMPNSTSHFVIICLQFAYKNYETLNIRKVLTLYQQGWRHLQGEEQLTEAGSTASPVWMGEAGAEAVGGGRPVAGPQRPEGAGGEEAAWILHCCEVGRA